jgi:hypothetical protein
MIIATPLGPSQFSALSSGLFSLGDVLALWARTRVGGFRNLGWVAAEAGASKAPKRRASTVDRMPLLLGSQPELSLGDIAAALGRSLRTLERTAANLQAQARLRHRGPSKGGGWEATKGDP